MVWVWTERQTDQEEIKSDSGSALWTILRVRLFGLREAVERGMTERNDGGMKARRGPLGGSSDRTDSPSIKLIIENMGKSYYCGCNWGMEKINRPLRLECQGGNHIGLWEKNICREGGYWLSFTNWIFITATRPLCTEQRMHTHTLYCEKPQKRMAAKHFF